MTFQKEPCKRIGNETVSSLSDFLVLSLSVPDIAAVALWDRRNEKVPSAASCTVE